MENASLGTVSLFDERKVPTVQTTLEQLFSSRFLKVAVEAGVAAAVIAIQRYLSEKPCGHQQEQHDSYSYDVTLTDGVWRTRCVLDRSLNHLIQNKSIRTGIEICITNCSFVYNEKRLGHGYIRIENIKFTSNVRTEILDGINNVNGLATLVKHGIENTPTQDTVPVQMTRKHYLPLWNTEDPEGDQWILQRPTSEVVLDVSKIALLCDLDSSLGKTWRHLPLLVRVLHKSRLRYYGKCDMKIDYPYQAYFEVADQSGTMSLVLWNELCLAWFHTLEVGTVLYLQNYTVKESYSKRSRPQMYHHRLKIFNSLEISLNHRNQASVLTVVSPKNLPPQWGLPEVAYQFTTRSELENLADNSACDVIGLVTFVGRVERCRKKDNKGPEKYWTYRWVHVVDGTSNIPFILEIFSSSQPEIFNAVCPLTYLVCTQMRVCQVESSRYLTSSCETEIFITGYHKGQPYVSDPKVKTFIQWTKTLKDSVVLKNSAVGGYYSFPHAPKVFTLPMELGSVRVPLVAADEMRRELESLQYREHKRIAIQGHIMAMRYCKSTKDEEPNREEVVDLSVEASGARLETELSESGTTSQTVPPGDKTLAGKRKRGVQKSGGQRSYMTCARLKTKRLAGCENTVDGPEENVSESEGDEQAGSERGSANQVGPVPSHGDPAATKLSWEASDWSQRRQEVSEHLRQGGLYQDSLIRKFTLEEESQLLHWNNLPPSRWTPEQRTGVLPAVPCRGYFQTTILGINKQVAIDAAFYPVASSGDPRAAGLSLEPHGNALLSCLSSGFLCPLGDPEDQSEAQLPSPEELLQTAGELEEAHVLCILDLCHIGGDQVETVISRVYRVTDFTLV